jgi:hypothetical protein
MSNYQLGEIMKKRTMKIEEIIYRLGKENLGKTTREFLEDYLKLLKRLGGRDTKSRGVTDTKQFSYTDWMKYNNKKF